MSTPCQCSDTHSSSREISNNQIIVVFRILSTETRRTHFHRFDFPFWLLVCQNSVFLFFQVSLNPVICRVLFHIIMKEESAPGILTITTALSNFNFLNHPHILHVFAFIFPCRCLQSTNGIRCPQSIDGRHLVALASCVWWHWPVSIHQKCCLILFHFNCCYGYGYKLQHTKGWQIMTKGTRVLSCVASSGGRKEIIAAELTTWNFLSFSSLPHFPPPITSLFLTRMQFLRSMSDLVEWHTKIDPINNDL